MLCDKRYGTWNRSHERAESKNAWLRNPGKEGRQRGEAKGNLVQCGYEPKCQLIFWGGHGVGYDGGFLAAGCAHVDIKDPDPALKIPGIKRAASEKDLSQRQELVKDLESDDAAVRFYAINALERLTGVTGGYEYYGDEASLSLERR